MADSVLEHLENLLTTLRPHFTPYTQSIPPILSDPAKNLLGESCYKTLIHDFDPLSSPACIKLAVSKAIGVGIISLSTIVKVPQLLKLISSGSSQGLSFLSYLLETTAYLITLAYNFRSGNPFSTFGEIAMIAVQNVGIATLVLHYSGRTVGAAVFGAAVAAGAYALFEPSVLSMEQVRILQAATIPLGLASKVPQIWTVARNKSTGQLSAFAVFNYLFGSLARVFTTLAEVDDPLILWGFLGGAFLNIVLAAQMLWYWNSGVPLGSAGSKKEKKFYKSPSKKAASSGGGGKKRA